MGDLVELVHFIRDYEALGCLVLFNVGLLARWWILGHTHREIVAKHKRAEELWRQIALQGAEQTGRALGVVERIRS